MTVVLPLYQQDEMRFFFMSRLFRRHFCSNYPSCTSSANGALKEIYYHSTKKNLM